ncbi:hypothetical protein BUE76_13590 [Cnuella takakiae]|nr:hypothetical protein BUE76_13590 [Cnuella takakiae]
MFCITQQLAAQKHSPAIKGLLLVPVYRLTAAGDCFGAEMSRQHKRLLRLRNEAPPLSSVQFNKRYGFHFNISLLIYAIRYSTK